ncbi:acyl-CoA dehydrogenase family protein [bacterium]|nr:acyl-CoA dehydrogenase family protein [bacterium]
MDYFLTEEQIRIRELTRQIAEEQIKPVRQHYDETEDFPRDIVKILAEAGLFKLVIPKEYSGTGGGVLEMVIATEELSRICGGISLAYAGTFLGTFPILLFGSDAQKARYLPSIAAGKTLAAFALTEPNAGSDAGAVQTKATREGDHYIINGTKQWITNGREADIYSVIASTNPDRGARGISAFIVEKSYEGFSFGKKENKLGIRGSTTMELVFDNCRVPAENLLRKEGLGFIIAMRTFDTSRPGVASQALGIAQGALDEAMIHLKDQYYGGKPISSSQGIQWILADIATEIEAARCLIYTVAKNIDCGGKNISKISAMTKVYASDVAMRATSKICQIFREKGYTGNYPFEKMLRDAKITQIYEGTNQIQRSIIGVNLIKEMPG